LNPDLHLLHYPTTHDSQSGKAEQSERIALHFPYELRAYMNAQLTHGGKDCEEYPSAQVKHSFGEHKAHSSEQLVVGNTHSLDTYYCLYPYSHFVHYVELHSRQF